ncbi:unnamed protein product [Discosporangium mesarthrocarpum]
MLRTFASKFTPVALKVTSFTPSVGVVPSVAARALSGDAKTPPPASSDKAPEVVQVELVDSLEWTLSSPPPIHQFDEPPIIVEISEC